MSEEWSEWIEHDGKGCPCVGYYIQEKAQWKGYKRQTEGLVRRAGADWDWSNYPKAWRILRYRIRKPRALEQLRKLAQDVEKVREMS